MNQKDYKAIAEIFDRCYASTTEAEKTKRNIAEQLADYFEKESDDCIKSNDGLKDNIHIGKSFDRKQFLKECGVE